MCAPGRGRHGVCFLTPLTTLNATSGFFPQEPRPTALPVGVLVPLSLRDRAGVRVPPIAIGLAVAPCRPLTLSLSPWEREGRGRACSNSECLAEATCRPDRLRHSRGGGNQEWRSDREAGKKRRRWIPAFAGMTTACAGVTGCVRVSCLVGTRPPGRRPLREAGCRQVAPSSILTQVVFTNAAQGGWTRSRLNPRGLCF